MAMYRIDTNRIQQTLNRLESDEVRIIYLKEKVAYWKGEQQNATSDEYRKSCSHGLKWLRNLLTYYTGKVKADRAVADTGAIETATKQFYEEPTAQEKMLADSCPLFGNAQPETQRIVWKLVLVFTRKQWAYFSDRTKMFTRATKVDRARRIAEISGLTNLRDLFEKPPSDKDKEIVNSALTLLKADAIKTESRT